MSVGTFDLVFEQPTQAPAQLLQFFVGPPGPALGGPDGKPVFVVENRLSEIATDPAAQAAAQQNLGLGTADPLAYYILAKA